MAKNGSTRETPPTSAVPPPPLAGIEASPPRQAKQSGVPKDIIMTPPTPRTSSVTVTASTNTTPSNSPTSIRAVRSPRLSPVDFSEESTSADVLGPLPTNLGGAAGLGSTDSLECSMRLGRDQQEGAIPPSSARRQVRYVREVDASGGSVGENSSATPFPEESQPPQRAVTAGSEETGGSSTLSAVTLPNELHELVDLDDIHGSGKGWIVAKGDDYRDHRFSTCDGSSLSSGTMRGPGSEIDADELDRLKRVRLSSNSIQFTREQFFKDEIMKGNFPTNADAPQEARSCTEDKWHFKSSKNLDDDIENDVVRMTNVDMVAAGKLQGYGNPLASHATSSSADALARHVRTARFLLILMVMACGAVIGYQIYRDEHASRSNRSNGYEPKAEPDHQGKAQRLIDLTTLCDEPSTDLCERVCQDARCCLEPSTSPNSCNSGANVTVCNKYRKSCALFFNEREDVKEDVKDVSVQGGSDHRDSEPPTGNEFPHVPDSSLGDVCGKVPMGRDVDPDVACGLPEVQECIRLCSPSFCCYEADFSSPGTCHHEICGQYSPCTRLYVMKLWDCERVAANTTHGGLGGKKPNLTSLSRAPTVSPVTAATHGGRNSSDVNEEERHNITDVNAEDKRNFTGLVGGIGAPQGGDSSGGSTMTNLGERGTNANIDSHVGGVGSLGGTSNGTQGHEASHLGRSMNPGLRE